MSRSWCARSERRARSVGPCDGGASQLRALVSGRGAAAGPVSAPGFALTMRPAAPGAWCMKLILMRPSGSDSTCDGTLQSVSM